MILEQGKELEIALQNKNELSIKGVNEVFGFHLKIGQFLNVQDVRKDSW